VGQHRLGQAPFSSWKLDADRRVHQKKVALKMSSRRRTEG
jgi:hypothetical protein